MITSIPEVGDKVTYLAFPGAKYEHGIVKSHHPTRKDIVFVVYKCNRDWDNYMNYTGVSTNLDSLEFGWLK